MTNNHWQVYHSAWSRLTPPLRPHADVIAAVKEQIGVERGRALLLGVTPELADVASCLVAVDRNTAMVANIWPGNTASRCALVGDWRRSSFSSAAFSLCIGDGSLSSLNFPDDIAAVARELRRIVRSGGKVICRLYLPPRPAETVRALRDEAIAGAIGNFHAFKIRLAMALAAQQPQPNVRVAAILEAFDVLFGNRDELVRATGWSRAQVDTIDFYKGSAASYSLPAQDQLLAVIGPVFPGARLVPSGGYEMAELCPLLVAEAP